MPTATAAKYRWDESSRRFLTAKGRPVARTQVRAALDTVLDGLSADARSHGEDLTAGRINTSEFALRMRALVKRGHTIAGAAGAGGTKQATRDPGDLGYVGSQVKGEYGYLSEFVRQVEAGEVPLDGRIAARAEMYARGATGTYEGVLRRGDQRAGFRFERRRLNSSVSCPECSAYAAKGWQPIGTLPNVGDACSCRSMCRCSFERKGKSATPVAVRRQQQRTQERERAEKERQERERRRLADEERRRQEQERAKKEAEERDRKERERREERARERERQIQQERERTNRPAPPPPARPETPVEKARREIAAAKQGQPDRIPPGHIADRIARYKVGDVKVAKIVEVGGANRAEAARLEADRARAARALADANGRLGSLERDAGPRPSPKKRAALEQARAEVAKLENERNRARGQLEGHRIRERSDIADLLAVDNPTRVEARYATVLDVDGNRLDPPDPENRRRVSEATGFLGKVLAKGDSDTLSAAIGQAPPGGDQRAHYSNSFNYINIKRDEDVSVVVHEYGHAIDNRVKAGGESVNERSQEFLAHRVGNETPVKLADKFPAVGYAPSEYGRKDKFDRAFDERAAHYVGKDYGPRSTEIVSMGVEKLYNDPVAFAEKDPEYCKFILGILDGSLR